MVITHNLAALAGDIVFTFDPASLRLQGETRVKVSVNEGTIRLFSACLS